MKLLNEENFKQEVLDENEKVVLVDFYADWCGPCRALSPVLDKVESESGDKVKVMKVDIVENMKLAETWKVDAIPVLIFFKGGEEKKRLVGLSQIDKINEAVSSCV